MRRNSIDRRFWLVACCSTVAILLRAHAADASGWVTYPLAALAALTCLAAWDSMEDA